MTKYSHFLLKKMEIVFLYFQYVQNIAKVVQWRSWMSCKNPEKTTFDWNVMLSCPWFWPSSQVSKAAADLMAYCDAHSCDDPLISPVPISENPYREKKFFCALLWDQSGIAVIKSTTVQYVQCVHVLLIWMRHQCTIGTLHKSCRCTVHNQLFN